MGTRALTKKALAAEAWQPLVRFLMETNGHRAKVLQGEGLTPNDAKALIALDDTEGRTMSDLADLWVCDASNATWIVDRLEERGLAERRTVPTDRRVKLVVLTPLGVTTRDRVTRALYEPPPELLSLRREDLEALRDAAARLRTISPSGAGRMLTASGNGARRGT